MHLLNLSLMQFVALFGSLSAFLIALYLLDRSRRRQVVSTLRFWVAAEQPVRAVRRRRIQQPWSLVLQLISIGLLLLALGQLRWGRRPEAAWDHVIVLETSAWMSARSGPRTLMDVARDRALAYLRTLPAGDRVMLVRADALATPATAFEPNRKSVERAIAESQPGSTAVDLDQALAFARRVQSQGRRRPGEIAFVGAGRIAETDRGAARAPVPSNLRVLPLEDQVENVGLRKIGVRRLTTDPELWEIFVSARNYGAQPRTTVLSLGFGPSEKGQAAVPVGARRLSIPPGAEREVTFEFRTRARGLLEARLTPADAFALDDRALLELPEQRQFRVAVYSDDPEPLRPLLAANPRVSAVFRSTAEYRPDGAQLIVLDRFQPAWPPRVDSVWIDPPAQGCPVPVRARPGNVPFVRWLSQHPLGAGLRTKDVRLEAASVFQAGPDDIKVGEVAEGPVIVARESTPKVFVMGFHPGAASMRYELATPLLFANVLQWAAPEIFRRWESVGGSVGTVKAALDSDVAGAAVRVLHQDGSVVPFTVRNGAVEFFAGRPGTVRILAGNREYVYSLTLPQLGELKWQAPEGVRHGLPRLRIQWGPAADLWPWLALLGACGLIVEWILYGRYSRRMARRAAAPALSRAERVGAWR